MVRSIAIIGVALAGLMAMPVATSAEEAHVAPIKKILPDIQAAIVKDDVIQALRDSNAKRSGMKQADIDAMEATWQKEIDLAVHPLVDSVVDNPIAVRMRKVTEEKGDLINEIGVIDAKGLSIAQSSPNSDIWQGEEVKFTKTYLVGPDAVFVDEVEFDGSTQQMQSQANFTVKDPDTGKAIGAVTVGINVDAVPQ